MERKEIVQLKWFRDALEDAFRCGVDFAEFHCLAIEEPGPRYAWDGMERLLDDVILKSLEEK